MQWEFNLPVKIVFGSGKRAEIEKYIDETGGTRGVLVCSASVAKRGVANEFIKKFRRQNKRDFHGHPPESNHG